MEPSTTLSPVTSNGKPPEKYIRTFASDMDISQKGGTPGLVPFKEPQIAVPEPVVVQSPITVTPLKAPEPVPPPPVEKEEKIVIKEKETVPTPIETYSEDFRQKIKETNASTVTVLAAEQDAVSPVSEPGPQEKTERSHNLSYLIAGVLLLGIGGGGVYVAYSRYLSALAPVAIAPASSSPIFVDSRERVSGTGTALSRAIEQSVAEPLTPATIRLLTLDVPTIDTNVFSALKVPAPGILLRNIQSAGSVAGVVSTSGGQSPFFILTVDSYSATFSGMLAWESTMPSDLGALFPMYAL